MFSEPVTMIVKSSDGVEFAVLTDRRASGYELAFARARPAAELALHTDFLRVDSSGMTEAPGPQDDILPAHETDGETEALRRAQAKWRTAAVVQGDKP